MYVYHDLVGEITKAWHLARMDGELAKILTSGKPEERRIKGRPKFRWLDNIKNLN
jgi:hypothetical protein